MRHVWHQQRSTRFTRVAAAAFGVALLSSCGTSASSVTEDAVWGSSIYTSGAADEVKQYENLAEMTEDADVVVVGNVESIKFSRTFGADEALGAVDYALMQLRVESVLSDSSGATKLASDNAAAVAVGGTIDLEFMMEKERIPEIEKALPTATGVYFLANEALDAKRFGSPSSPEDAGYYVLVSSQGLLQESNGLVSTPLRAVENVDLEGVDTSPGEEPEGVAFPGELRGMPFDVLVDQVATVGTDASEAGE